MKSAIVIGASSGIGRALAVALSLDGYRVGVVARRAELLAELQAELAGPCVIKTIHVSGAGDSSHGSCRPRPMRWSRDSE